MTTVRALYYEQIEVLEDTFVSHIEVEDQYLKVINRSGQVVANLLTKNPESYYVKALRVVGAFDTDYREKPIKEWTRPGALNMKLTPPVTLPTGTVFDLAWTLDSRYMTVGHNVSPFFTTYKRSGDTLTKLTNPTTLPTTAVEALAWSPDGRLLVVATSVSPRLLVYSRTGDVLSKVTDSAAIPHPPTVNVKSLQFSPDARYLAVGITAMPYLLLYDRGIDPMSSVLTRVSDLSETQMPYGVVDNVTWSPDMQYLFVGQETAPYMAWYKRAGSLLTKLPEPSWRPSSAILCSSWSPDGQFLAIGLGTANRLYIYKREGDSLTLVEGTPSLSAFNVVNDVSWTPDGKYLITSVQTTPFIKAFKVNLNTGMITEVGQMSSTPSGEANRAQISPDGKHLAVGYLAAPYLDVYKSVMGPTSGAAIRIDKDYPLPIGAPT